MCPSAPRVCSEPGGQKPVLSLSLDLIEGNLSTPSMFLELFCLYKRAKKIHTTPPPPHPPPYTPTTTTTPRPEKNTDFFVCFGLDVLSFNMADCVDMTYLMYLVLRLQNPCSRQHCHPNACCYFYGWPLWTCTHSWSITVLIKVVSCSDFYRHICF